jgi:FtsH-binding integral membrane protein
MTLDVACGKLRAMIARPHDSDAPSLGLVLVNALMFWLRHQGVFWLMALPIAGLAAAITYVLEANQALVDWRHHWGWDVLFALIYAMFLDRWIKEALLEDASPCDEADALRGSTIAPRFLVFAAILGLMATALALLPHAELSAVLWTAAASLFVLMLPSLAAGEPSPLRQAFALGRPLQVHLFLLIGGAVALWFLADPGPAWVARHLPDRPWNGAVVAAAHRLIDALLLTFVGYGLAALFREVSGWRQPEPDGRLYRRLY